MLSTKEIFNRICDVPALHRKVLALVIGLVVAVWLTGVWLDYAAPLAQELLGHKRGYESDFPDGAVHLSGGWELDRIIFERFLPGLAGLITTLLIWDFSPSQWYRRLTFFVVFACILALTALNYRSADTFVSASKQAAINCILIFLGIVAVLTLARTPLRSTTLMIVRAMIVFVLAAQSILLPSLFTIIWWLDKQGVKNLDLSPGAILAVVGGGSLAAAVLAFLRGASSPSQKAEDSIGTAEPRSANASSIEDTISTAEPRSANASSIEDTIGTAEPGSANASSIPDYDVALSFAGEDREHARHAAELLRQRNLTVFYDQYEQASMWGQNLYTHLSDVYQHKARYCLMFISANYAQKLWTKHERQAAQARAFRERREYILPLRLDDTKIPGIEDTVGYLDLRTMRMEQVIELLVQKLDVKV